MNPAAPTPDYEATDASPRGILAVAAIVFGVTVAVLAGTWLTLRAPRPSPDGSFTHGPKQITSIQQSWREIEAARADSYGWIDRDHGIVRIPVDRALQLVAREHAAQP